MNKKLQTMLLKLKKSHVGIFGMLVIVLASVFAYMSMQGYAEMKDSTVEHMQMAQERAVDSAVDFLTSFNTDIMRTRSPEQAEERFSEVMIMLVQDTTFMLHGEVAVLDLDKGVVASNAEKPIFEKGKDRLAECIDGMTATSHNGRCTIECSTLDDVIHIYWHRVPAPGVTTAQGNYYFLMVGFSERDAVATIQKYQNQSATRFALLSVITVASAYISLWAVKSREHALRKAANGTRQDNKH